MTKLINDDVNFILLNINETHLKIEIINDLKKYFSEIYLKSLDMVLDTLRNTLSLLCYHMYIINLENKLIEDGGINGNGKKLL